MYRLSAQSCSLTSRIKLFFKDVAEIIQGTLRSTIYSSSCKIFGRAYHGARAARAQRRLPFLLFVPEGHFAPPLRRWSLGPHHTSLFINACFLYCQALQRSLRQTPPCWFALSSSSSASNSSFRKTNSLSLISAPTSSSVAFFRRTAPLFFCVTVCSVQNGGNFVQVFNIYSFAMALHHIFHVPLTSGRTSVFSEDVAAVIENTLRSTIYSCSKIRS